MPCRSRRLGKARERLLEATGDYALPHGGQLDEITGVRKQTRVRDLQFKVRHEISTDRPSREIAVETIKNRMLQPFHAGVARNNEQ